MHTDLLAGMNVPILTTAEIPTLPILTGVSQFLVQSPCLPILTKIAQFFVQFENQGKILKKTVAFER